MGSGEPVRLLVNAVVRLLIRKRVITAAELSRQLEEERAQDYRETE